MNIIQCPYCKVRYKESSVTCPICNKSIDGMLQVQEVVKKLPTKMHFRNVLLIIVFIVLLMPCIVVLTSNYMQDHTLTWSPLVVVVLMFSYGYFCLLMMLYKRKVFLCIVLTALTIFFLFVLDTMMPSRWFISLAFPITILWVILAYIAFMWITKLSIHGFVMVGIILFFVAIALMGTDIVIKYEIKKTFSIGWSAISTSALVPLTAVMFYLQKHKRKLEKWLHF